MHTMSSVFSKSREKRGRTSSGETNNSFVKNVTSRMSGLIPATITKWFSSPSSANGSAPVAEITDSSSDDEALESTSSTPPSKRRRISSPRSNCSCIKTTANASTETDALESFPTSVLYNNIQSSSNSPRQDTTNYIPTKESTSESDKDVPHHSKAEPTVSFFRQTTAPRKSIFDMAPSAKNRLLNACATAENTHKDLKAPYFSPSLLGSSFYVGKTMYGGASSSTYINQPNIKQRKVAQVKQSKHNDTVNMSYSARQVMDLLENITSPLSEARRIPVISRNPNASHSFTLDNSLPSTSTNNKSYRSQELYVPSIASILSLKQRSRLMDTTKAARQIIASHSSTLSNFQPYTVDTGRQGNNGSNQIASDKEPAKSDVTHKMKTRLTRKPRTRDAIDGGAELPETVELPTAVLQIDQNNLPKFSFGNTQTSSSPTSAKTTFTQTSSESVSVNKANDVPGPTLGSSSMFKFSSPVKIMDTHSGDLSPPAFKFGSPERRVDYISESPFKLRPISSLIDNYKNESQSDWNCPDCMVKNKSSAEKCPCCGAKQPSKDVKQNKPVTNTNSMPLTGINLSANWSCSDCWASNPPNNDKCLCCGGKNPTKEAPPSFPKSESLNKDWKCGDCWIPNKSSVDKCAACGGAKPGSKSAAPSLPVTSFSTKTIVNGEKDKTWQCQTCSVMNSDEKSSCVCCGIEKSGGDKESGKKLFNFSTNANVSFKFGIDPKLQEAALKKSEEVTENAFTKTTEESETNNNVVPKIQTSGFTFTSQNTLSKSDDKVEGKTPTFTFGIPKPTHTLTTEATFSVIQPDILLKSQKAEDKENPQEVPKIDFKSPVQESTKPSGFFGSSITGNLSEQPTPTFGVFSNDKEKNESLSPISSAAKDDKPATFTFGSGAVKPATIFGAPANTNAPASITSNPLLTTATTSSTPSLSLFQKPETTTLSMSLFPSKDSTSSVPSSLFQQKSETTTPATSIFSFGSNTQSSTVAPSTSATLDKPKFNFTFGSSSTENQSSGLFKSPFSATTENNGNKFGLPTSTPLGNTLGNNGISTGNVLGGNVLGGSTLGGNGLGANNLGGSTLGGSTLGGNTLGGSTLGGNTLGGNTLGGNALGASTLGGNTLGGNSLGGNTLGGKPLGGNTLGGNTLGGSTLGGSTLGGSTLGGSTLGGSTLGGSTLGGSTLGGSTLGGNTLGGNTLGGNTLGGNTLGGNTLGGNTLAGNTLGGNTLGGNTMGGNILGGNTLGGNALGGNTLGGNTLGGNGLGGNNNSMSGNILGNNSDNSMATTPIFGSAIQKAEPSWPNNNASTNIFASNPTNNMSKPAPFTFGAPTPFNASNTPSNPPAQNIFGASPQPSQNVFGMGAQNNASQPSLFQSQPQSQPAPMFGSSNPTPNPFGTPSAPAPAFGTANPTMGSSFENPSMTPAPTPTFNFGQPQQAPAVFGFGQSTPQGAGVYNFSGASPGPPQQLQFNMGSAPNSNPNPVRRMRKAVRRNPPR